MKKPVEKARQGKEKAANAETVPLKRRILHGIGLSAWVLFGFVATNLLVATLIRFLVDMGLINVDVVLSSVFNTAYAAIIYSLTLGVVIWIPYKWRGFRVSREELGLNRRPNLTDILYAPASYIVYFVCAIVLVAAVLVAFPGIDLTQKQNVGFSDLSHWYEYILAFLTLVVIAPIAEEVLMRGYLYSKLRKFLPIVAAALVTSLLFSLMHFQLNVALNVLPLGIVLVALREMTGSIWAGIFLHMLKNGIAFYLLFVNPSLPGTIGL